MTLTVHKFQEFLPTQLSHHYQDRRCHKHLELTPVVHNYRQGNQELAPVVHSCHLLVLLLLLEIAVWLPVVQPRHLLALLLLLEVAVWLLVVQPRQLLVLRQLPERISQLLSDKLF